MLEDPNETWHACGVWINIPVAVCILLWLARMSVSTVAKITVDDGNEKAVL